MNFWAFPAASSLDSHVNRLLRVAESEQRQLVESKEAAWPAALADRQLAGDDWLDLVLHEKAHPACMSGR